MDKFEDISKIEFESKVDDNELLPISHKEFNDFIKGKGVIGRNNYKLKDLKAMFGFKPMVNRNQVTVTIDDGREMGTYDSMSKTSMSVGIPYTTLQQAKKKSKNSNPVAIKSGGNLYVIKLTLYIKCHTVISNRDHTKTPQALLNVLVVKPLIVLLLGICN